MWTISFTFFTLIFSFLLLLKLRTLIKNKRTEQLEREIENDLKAEFPGAFEMANDGSDDFVNWLEGLQSEDETSKSTGHDRNSI